MESACYLSRLPINNIISFIRLQRCVNDEKSYRNKDFYFIILFVDLLISKNIWEKHHAFHEITRYDSINIILMESN